MTGHVTFFAWAALFCRWERAAHEAAAHDSLLRGCRCQVLATGPCQCPRSASCCAPGGPLLSAHTLPVQEQQDFLQPRMPSSRQIDGAELPSDAGSVQHERLPEAERNAAQWRVAHLSSDDVSVLQRHDAGSTEAAHWDPGPGAQAMSKHLQHYAKDCGYGTRAC